MTFQFKHVGTYIGANSFVVDKAIVFEIIGDLSINTGSIRNRLIEIDNLLPQDFKIMLPQLDCAIFDCIAAFVLELLNYVRGEIKFCRILKREEGTFIVCDYHEPKVVVEVLKFTGWVLNISNFEKSDVLEAVNHMWDLCQSAHPDYQASFLISHAIESGLFYSHLGNKKWIYGTGSGSSVYFESSRFEDIGLKSQKLSKTKCKSYFQDSGAPTPKYITAYSVEEAMQKLQFLKLPVAVKPNDGGRGMGVTAKVTRTEDIGEAFLFAERARKNEDEPILIEEHIEGVDYRLTIIDHQLISISNRVPPVVTGNGIDSIEELILKENAKRTRNLKASKYLRKIRIDENVCSTLLLQGCKLGTILEFGKTVIVRDNSNVSSGGTYHSILEIDRDVQEIAERISRSVGSKVLGIDYITTDISKSPALSVGGFIELNDTPGIELITALNITHAEIGAKILKDCDNSAFIEVRVLSKRRLQEYIELDAPRNALVLPDIFFLNGVFKRIEGVNSALAIIAFYMAQKSDIKFIYLTDEFAMKFGVPILPNSKIHLGRNVTQGLIDMMGIHEINYDFLN
jgi:D-alanine-D-alanine ligase-like ATP-grasp enzyme